MVHFPIRPCQTLLPPPSVSSRRKVVSFASFTMSDCLPRASSTCCGARNCCARGTGAPTFSNLSSARSRPVCPNRRSRLHRLWSYLWQRVVCWLVVRSTGLLLHHIPKAVPHRACLFNIGPQVDGQARRVSNGQPSGGSLRLEAIPGAHTGSQQDTNPRTGPCTFSGGNLPAAVRFYARQAIAPTTRNVYTVGETHFLNLCGLHQRTSFPATEQALVEFIVHLADIVRCAPVTIKSYLSAVRNFHVEQEAGNPFANTTLPDLVFREVKRSHGVPTAGSSDCRSPYRCCASCLHTFVGARTGPSH